MNSSRPRPSSIPDRTTLFRWILYGFIILCMGNLGAMIDLVHHPDIPYFDIEHVIVGGVISMTMIFLLGALEMYLARRKHTEEALRESEERFRTLIETAHDIIWTLDLQGNVTYLNRRGEEISNYEIPEIVGKKYSFRVLEEDLPIVGDAVTQTLRGRPQSFEARVYLSDDTIVSLSVNQVPLYRSGELVGAVCFGRDITDRKRAEVEKARLEAQTRQLEKAESLRRLAGAVAHVFNNHLQTVIGFLHVALDKLPRGAEPVGDLTEALRAARQMAEVSGLMLTYVGKKHGERELLDLSDLCRRSLPLLRSTMPKHTALDADLPPAGPVINAALSQMERLLVILVTNAWEAVGNREGVIHLSVQTVSPGDIPIAHRCPIDWLPQDCLYACLEVADTGSGIDPKVMEKLTDPFFSTKFTGRGLGLALALGIVREHEGVISVESELGRGSIFRIFFPVSAEA